jgi:hypothetical protein
LDENEDIKKLYSAQYKPSDDTLNYYKIWVGNTSTDTNFL